MERFDVIIVGAGPAGGECARELAAAGKRVLLAERSRSFSVNSYSSAGAPNQLMRDFKLPESIVGSHWNRIIMHSSKSRRVWQSEKLQGVVLDFEKLRTYLADQCDKAGGKAHLGLRYTSHSFCEEGVEVLFDDLVEGCELRCTAKVLVDATGAERQVLAKSLKCKPASFPSTGIEYLIEVPSPCYEKWASALSFFLGEKWMPQGYSWIFPMDKQRLKVGVGRYFQDEAIVPHENSYEFYLKKLMREALGSDEFPVLDRHGKTIHYTCGRKDPHSYRNILAIGDAVSTINPLAFEGIRHAMQSSHIATKHILGYLEGKIGEFSEYQFEMKSRFNWSWRVCEYLMRMIYRERRDERVDAIVSALGTLSMEEMLQLAFHYRLKQVVKFLLRYYFTR